MPIRKLDITMKDKTRSFRKFAWREIVDPVTYRGFWLIPVVVYQRYIVLQSAIDGTARDVGWCTVEVVPVSELSAGPQSVGE